MTTVTAPSQDQCFPITAPSSSPGGGAPEKYLQQLRAAEMAALFFRKRVAICVFLIGSTKRHSTA